MNDMTRLHTPMHGTELRECLDSIGMTQADLGRFLYASRRSPGRWARDRCATPQAVADWARAVRAIADKRPRPTYAEWAAQHGAVTEVDHQRMFDLLHALGWSIEELCLRLGIEPPVWDTSVTVKGGDQLLLGIMATHGWQMSGLASRVTMSDDEARGTLNAEAHTLYPAPQDGPMFFATEKWTIKRANVGEMISGATGQKIAQVEAVLDGSAELPATVAAWVVQRYAFHNLTRGHMAVAPKLLAWLEMMAEVRLIRPDGWMNQSPDQVAEPVTYAADPSIDLLTGGDLT